MFGFWYNSSMRNYIVMMGDLFSNVQVMRKRDDKIDLQRVPITYASKERFMMKLDKLNSINSTKEVAKVDTVLPRMSLNMLDIVYNGMYATSNQIRSIQESRGTFKDISQYNSTPYKMIFELSIWTRHMDDMFQIIEQILPYFQPHFTTTITELHNNQINYERDIPVTLQSVAIDDIVETDTGSRRQLQWSIVFEVPGWLYPPVANIEGQIKTIYLDFHNNMREISNADDVYESVDYQIDPVDANFDEWLNDPKFIESLSENQPIPKDPNPPKVRENP